MASHSFEVSPLGANISDQIETESKTNSLGDDNIPGPHEGPQPAVGFFWRTLHLRLKPAQLLLLPTMDEWSPFQSTPQHCFESRRPALDEGEKCAGFFPPPLSFCTPPHEPTRSVLPR